VQRRPRVKARFAMNALTRCHRDTSFIVHSVDISRFCAIFIAHRSEVLPIRMFAMNPLEELNALKGMLSAELNRIPAPGTTIEAKQRLELRKGGKRIKAYAGVLLDLVNKVEISEKPPTAPKK